MDNFLEKIDQVIVVTINSWHTPLLDEVMYLVSSKIAWIPLYFFLVYLAYKKLPFKQVVFFVSIAIVSVIFSDLVSNYCFKEVFQRYRPSHNLLLMDKLHLYEMKKGEFYQGGKYGFISSHASNFFSFSIFVGLSLKKCYGKLIYILLLISCVVSISRVYLGVHYLSDIIIGAIVGSGIAYLLYRFVYLRFLEKFSIR